MIVRIHGEGQWVIDDDQLTDLNEIDAKVSQAISDGNQAELTAAMTKLLDTVRDKGDHIPDDVIAESNLILPAADITLDEIMQWLDEDNPAEGLIAD